LVVFAVAPSRPGSLPGRTDRSCPGGAVHRNDRPALRNICGWADGLLLTSVPQLARAEFGCTRRESVLVVKCPSRSPPESGAGREGPFTRPACLPTIRRVASWSVREFAHARGAGMVCRRWCGRNEPDLVERLARPALLTVTSRMSAKMYRDDPCDHQRQGSGGLHAEEARARA
jgi:hypothetical protein